MAEGSSGIDATSADVRASTFFYVHSKGRIISLTISA